MIDSLRFKKNVEIVALPIASYAYTYKLYLPHPSCYLTSIVDKTQDGLVIDPFSVQLLQLFLATSEGS